MIGPGLSSGIEQGNKLPGLAIYSAHLAALKPVAVEAGPRQIVVTFSTPVLARDDVIGFMALGGVILVEMAILTAVAGSLGNSQALRGRNGHDIFGC